MADKKKITGLDIELNDVATRDEGALYQLVEGDPTNPDYVAAMQKSRKNAKELED